MTTQRPVDPESPRIHVSFLGREYAGAQGAETFEIVSTLTNLYDGWTLSLPIGPDGILEDIPGMNVHRWIPVKLAHSDPKVDNGKPVPMLQGVCTRVEHHTSDGASILKLSGFDLGKLLDSCAKPWIRLRGLSLGAIVDKLVDPTWLAKNRTDSWGIQGVTALNRDRSLKLGQKVSLGRQQAQLDVGKAYGQLMPPLQTEVGETVADTVSRFARLTGLTASQGSFVSCSADGYAQIFNPDDYKDADPLYVFNDHDDARNLRIKRSSLLLNGEDLYTEYNCYGSVIAPPQQFAQDKITNPNAGRFFGQDNLPGYLGPRDNPIFRRLTFPDPEQYKQGFAQVRATWRLKQSLYGEWAVRLTIQGHSMPGPDGKWRPIVEGNVAELNSTRLRQYGRFMIEQVVKRQNTQGTECDVVLPEAWTLGSISMPKFTYTPVGGTEIDLGKYAPGLESAIAGRWGRHPIPGQQGDLKEDLGQGSLVTRVKLQFVGKTAPDYYTVIPAMSKNRRGTLLHLLRGARDTVIDKIREEVLYTERGNAVLVDIDFEDAVLGQADSFRPGPSARAQEVVSQSRAADAAAMTLQTQMFGRPDLVIRAYAVAATLSVGSATTAARAYSAAAQDSFSLGFYGPSVQAQLKALPPLVQAAQAALRLVGSAADIQDTAMALEVMLFASSQLDAAIEQAQPIPVTTKITRPPGQSIYAFVQQWYGKSGKTPAEMRDLVGLILRLNPQIRRPSLIPDGTFVVRPV